MSSISPGLSLIVDASGNPASGTFGATLPTVNVAGVATGSSAGVPIGGLSPSGKLTPLAIDAYGSLTVRPGVCPTWTATTLGAISTGTTAGKCMLSIFNGSNAATVTRLVWLIAQCPPQTDNKGGLLGIGSGGSYMQIIFAAYRITGHSGGTPLARVAADPGDDASLEPACTVLTGATVTGKAMAPSYAWDAAYDASAPIGPRPDICTKVHTIPPGTGLGIFNQNALSTPANFLLTVTCSQNIA